MKVDITLDFDGTVTLGDVTELILDRCADPKWREVEAEWVAGRIGSRECLAQQAALLSVSPAELDALLDTVKIDPDFSRFVQEAHALGATMKSSPTDSTVSSSRFLPASTQRFLY